MCGLSDGDTNIGNLQPSLEAALKNRESFQQALGPSTEPDQKK